jgi:hypothetical protein
MHVPIGEPVSTSPEHALSLLSACAVSFSICPIMRSTSVTSWAGSPTGRRRTPCWRTSSLICLTKIKRATDLQPCAEALPPRALAYAGKLARTELCGGREVTRVPTATQPDVCVAGDHVDWPSAPDAGPGRGVIRTSRPVRKVSGTKIVTEFQGVRPTFQMARFNATSASSSPLSPAKQSRSRRAAMRCCAPDAGNEPS